MRLFQAQYELPALARAHAARVQMRIMLDFDIVVRGPREPEQLQMPRHLRTGRQHLLHIESEAHATLAPLRQLRHHAYDTNIPAFPGFGQGIGQTPVRHAGRPSRAGVPHQDSASRGGTRASGVPTRSTSNSKRRLRS